MKTTSPPTSHRDHRPLRRLPKSQTFGLLSVVAALLMTQPVLGSSALEDNFVHPPPAARPWVYWFWLNGNINSNGITADLEAMQRVGIGGVLIMEVDQGAPKGPADFGSPQWRGLFQHVCAEAHRLGLEVNMNNDAGWCGSGGPWITPELAMQKVVWSQTNVEGPSHFEGVLAQPQTVSNYYRDIAVLAFPTPAAGARLEKLEGKAAFTPEHLKVTDQYEAIPAEQTVPRRSIQVLTAQCGTNGQFAWTVPAGKWTILRLGHTTTGKDNHPAPEPGRGLESDKLSRAATDVMFDNLMGKLIADSKPLAGHTLVSTHIDSWETGSQNWTPRFREDFERLRGYDPLLLLPVLTGTVVDSAEVSERFLWDVRQTVSDLLVRNYAGEFRRLANQQGMRLSIEAYDGTPCDDLSYAGQADEPMAEFWSWGYNTSYSCVEMSSAAHVYGKRILGAEAFTATDGEKWQLYPGAIKTLGDWAFCEGINRFVFHRYALQPWLNRPPGMSMGPWGLHYERTETWWEQAAAWHEYLARCQYLLRQGLFVADICFLEPEGSPRRFTPTMSWRSGNTPDRPRYNFDGCSPEVLLTRMRVKDGRIVLPDGMSYRVLVLPQVGTMTPRLLHGIQKLVQAGATVIGPPPRQSPSLSGYPQCDQEIAKLTGKLWASSGSSGKLASHVIWDQSLETRQATPARKSPLQAAQWISYPEGNPAVSAPPGTRYFRRVVELPAAPVSAQLVLTVDNSFELWVNGRAAGTGDNFNQTYSFDIRPLLHVGTNVLAVTAINAADYPNPAGVIGALRVGLEDGHDLQFNTDQQWQSATKVSADWRTEPSLNAEWKAAKVLGPLGMQPWGELDKAIDVPYVYPDFQAVTGVLKHMGIAPDFQADPGLRFIHRREGDIDIYFVANSQTNWLQSMCTFRVEGKRPELWDPMTGRIEQAIVYEAKDGRTVMPLAFEPAGSKFIVFRHGEVRSGEGAIADVLDAGASVFPKAEQGMAERPALVLTADPAGRARAVAFAAGTYQVRWNSGQRRTLSIPALPAAETVSGPWQVQFEPGRGAPSEITMPALADWSKSELEGVKYFSGSATYRKTFDPAGLRGEGLRQFLDLGSVAVMARVKLNGHDLGTLWKAPYAVEITGALQAGENHLEITVVNLWINRMIGDEQLPDDSERNANGTLKAWPAWLSTTEPSPTGRFTFTSWRLWKKDSPLQTSGLLGPVTISAAREVTLAR
ncbi:MAG TPA: glycosyl hydrolase [Verrucomicrobiae bacterium]|nr:glycosyl hydrolase [Verrucomicrobiae bacterium]